MAFDTYVTTPNQVSRLNNTQLIARVRADCMLRSSNRVADSDITAWLNEAQDEVATETHWFKQGVYKTQTAGTKEYDLPAGCLTVEELWSVSYKRQLIEMQPEELEALYTSSPNWRAASQGVPTLYYLQGNSTYGLHPTPVATTANETFIWYSALPSLASAGSDVFYIPAGGEGCLVAYACWRASLKDATGEGGRREQQFRAEYVDKLNRIKKQVEAINEDDIVVWGEWGSQHRSWRKNPRNDWEDGTVITSPG